MSTLAENQDRLAKYLAAETKILKSQEWSKGSTQIVHTQLTSVQRQIKLLQMEISKQSGNRNNIKQIVPRDT